MMKILRKIINKFRVFRNKRLCKKYPFLTCYTDYTETIPNYDFTWQDEIEEGWRKKFCPKMWEELKAILKKADYVDKLKFSDIKEKYGLLTIYYGGVPKEIYDEVFDWARKYEDLSEKICITCGKPATHMTTGWITYRCKHCIRRIERRDRRKGYVNFKINAIPIEDISEYYKDIAKYWEIHSNEEDKI